MKDQLQEELKAKVKPGIKPSALKNLKRSKSAGDIPIAPPLPNSTPLAKSQSQSSFNDPKYPYTTLIAQQEELEKLRKETLAKSTTITLLRKKVEELEKVSPNPKPNQELDQALIARHKNLKDWFQQYQKAKNLDQELSENIDQASQELINQNQTISNLKKENSLLKSTNQSLEKDLELAQRLAEMRSEPLSNPEWPTLSFSWGICLVIALALWMWIKPRNDL